MSEEVVVAMDMTVDLLMSDLWVKCKAATSLIVETLWLDLGHPPTIIGYSEVAHVLDPAIPPEWEPIVVYGANVQHALQMARYQLDEVTGHKRVIIIANTDASTFSNVDGSTQFDYPPSEECRRVTLNEARACSIARIRVDFLLLTPTAPIGEMASSLASECGGLVFRLSEAESLNGEVHAFLSDIDVASS
jgi:uncharacterized protein with von Willebrand factor type A (vWA) domain